MDILRTVWGITQKRFRDMGDTTHAEVIAIGAVAVPSNSPLTDQVKVSVTGTAVALSATSKPLPKGDVMIWAPSTNTGDMKIGGSGVTNVADGTGNGVVVPAGDVRLVFAEDLGDVYVNGAADDWIYYSAA